MKIQWQACTELGQSTAQISGCSPCRSLTDKLSFRSLHKSAMPCTSAVRGYSAKGHNSLPYHTANTGIPADTGAAAHLSFAFLPSSEAASSWTSCSWKAQWPPATCFWRVFLSFQLGCKSSSLQQLFHQLQSLLLQSHLCQQHKPQAWLSSGYRARTASKKDTQPPAGTQRKAGCAEWTWVALPWRLMVSWKLCLQDISVAEAGGSPALQATAWGGNARFNPSGKAAVSVCVQAPTWTFFKQLTAMSDLLLHMRCPTLRVIANPGSAHFPPTLWDPYCTEQSILSLWGCALKDKSAALERVEAYLSYAMPAHEIQGTWDLIPHSLPQCTVLLRCAAAAFMKAFITSPFSFL